MQTTTEGTLLPKNRDSKGAHPTWDGVGVGFPGRWVGGIAMIFGPLLLFIGVILRLPFPFFFPAQLAAFQEHPTLVFVAYNSFLAGNILLWPAIVTLAGSIGVRKPGWGVWGGSLVIFGLFARTFQAGVDHLAFQLVRVQNLELATRAVADSYGAFRPIDQTLNPAVFSGWIVLAIGAYLSGTVGLFCSIALGLMAALMIGVLKGSTLVSVVATAGLCVALVPLGFKILRAGPMPGSRAAVSWFLMIAAVGTVFFFLDQAG